MAPRPARGHAMRLQRRPLVLAERRPSPDSWVDTIDDSLPRPARDSIRNALRIRQTWDDDRHG